MMKNYFKFLIAFFTITIFLVSCGRGSDSPNPPATDTQKPTAPTNLTTNNITTNSFTLNWTASTDNVSVTGYNVYVNDVVIGSTTSTSYAVTGLTASTTYNVYVKAKDAAGNISDKSNTLSVNTSSVSYTAVVNTTTSYEGSTTATDKVLLGGSIAKGFVFDVTTAGTAKVEVLGTLTSGAPAVSYYWINGADNADINAACSTLNSTVSKTAINSQSFTINLNAGKNVICFKTARYSGLINNGGAVGLKITLASNVTFTTISYTADSVSGNVAAVQKQEHGLINGTTILSGEAANATWGTIKLTPYSDENATVYDGNLYPKISGLTLGTTADWSTGNVAGWSNLDFKNTQGTNGQNFYVKQFNSTSGVTNVFQNTNAAFNSNVLQFSLNTPFQITKSSLGNYAWMVVSVNVFNTSATAFGSANVSFVYKSVKFVGNPETWIYDVNGNRIQ